MLKVKLYDTTLRDGAQGEGISYSVMDKKGDDGGDRSSGR